MEQSRF